MTITIYQDMDGCVCDFALAIRDEIVRLASLSDEEIAQLESKTMRKGLKKYLKEYGRGYDLQVHEIDDKHVKPLLYKIGCQEGWFYGLPTMEHNGLWDWLKDSGFYYEFLTAPIGVYAEEDKTRYVRDILGSEAVVNVVPRVEKVTFARPNAVLIDDHPSTIEEWNAAGGKGFLWTGKEGGDIEALKIFIQGLQ